MIIHGVVHLADVMGSGVVSQELSLCGECVLPDFF